METGGLGTGLSGTIHSTASGSDSVQFSVGSKIPQMLPFTMLVELKMYLIVGCSKSTDQMGRK